MCAVTVQKRTARVKRLSNVSSASTLLQPTTMLLAISLGHRSWCLLSRDAPSDKPLSFNAGVHDFQHDESLRNALANAVCVLLCEIAVAIFSDGLTQQGIHGVTILHHRFFHITAD